MHDRLRQSEQEVIAIAPESWPAIIDASRARCVGDGAEPSVSVPEKTTLAACERLARAHAGQHVAALNFALARRPGGGWDTGAVALEETLGRASGMVATLGEAPEYYRANRACEHLFSTDQAIWPPTVPIFVGDDGQLLDDPYGIGISFITMAAPNVGAMVRLDEADLRAPPAVRPAAWRLGRALLRRGNGHRSPAGADGRLGADRGPAQAGGRDGGGFAQPIGAATKPWARDPGRGIDRPSPEEP